MSVTDSTYTAATDMKSPSYLNLPFPSAPLLFLESISHSNPAKSDGNRNTAMSRAIALYPLLQPNLVITEVISGELSAEEATEETVMAYATKEMN